MTAESIRSGLRNFARVYEYMKPYEKRELIRIVLSRAQIGGRTLILDVYETACAGFAQAVKSDSRSETPGWLPESVARSVLRDCWQVQLPSVMTLKIREKRVRRETFAHPEWAAAVASGVVSSKAELARRTGVSRAAVTLALKRGAASRFEGQRSQSAGI